MAEELKRVWPTRFHRGRTNSRPEVEKDLPSAPGLGGHSGLGRKESEERQRQKSRNREVLSVFSVFKEQYITQFD